MTTTSDPLDGVDRLIVDGTNLLHALTRGMRGGAPAERLPQAALIGRLRAAIPASVSIELMFDGPPERGMGTTRVAAGLVVRFSGRFTADRSIVRLVDEARVATGTAQGADNILVVTDDRELRLAVRDRGGRTARAAWLLARVERLERRRAPQPPPNPAATKADGAASGDADDGRPRWQPGRGATSKKGNPRRAPRRTSGRAPRRSVDPSG